MPRNSTSTMRKTSHVVSPLAPPMPPAYVSASNSPTLASVLGHSVASGVGSGVGFSLGSAFARNLFGLGANPSPSATAAVNEYTQCLEANKLNGNMATCYHLSDQYKACMVRTNFNDYECKRDM
jgi:hypothetical protein